ncbi:MAG: recombinase zinc beta ribbon domain-containing protein [Clostridiales bacterium]|nr:recombinase zinc beta ribbon domain-containing protein [Clostridiales bacterium]
MKKDRGKQMTAPFVPYGYKKDKKTGNQFIIDPYAARIVRRIFQYKLMGYTNAAIKDRLNSTGVLCPLEYKKEKGFPVTDFFQKNVQAVWHEQTILSVLKNPVYAGDLVLGKTQIISTEERRILVRKKEEDSMLQKDHHKPIVSRLVYDSVRRLLQQDTKAAPLEEKVYLFSGFLYCGDCGRPMTRTRSTARGKEYIYYICKGYKLDQGCTSHRVNEQWLESIVFCKIQKRLDALERLKERLDPLKQKDDYQWMSDFLEFGQTESLTRPMLSMFVNEIGVWNDEVQVKFTYEDKLRTIKNQIDGGIYV